MLTISVSGETTKYGFLYFLAKSIVRLEPGVILLTLLTKISVPSESFTFCSVRCNQPLLRLSSKPYSSLNWGLYPVCVLYPLGAVPPVFIPANLACWRNNISAPSWPPEITFWRFFPVPLLNLRIPSTSFFNLEDSLVTSLFNVGGFIPIS